MDFDKILIVLSEIELKIAGVDVQPIAKIVRRLKDANISSTEELKDWLDVETNAQALQLEILANRDGDTEEKLEG